jgi:hypothetical protein
MGVSQLKSTIAVVGAGPVGIFTSSKLLEKGLNVVLIESGTFKTEGKLSKKSYKFKTRSALPTEVHLVGGGSRKWLGRIGEFLEADFERRGLYFNYTWPFSKNDLSKYYRRLAGEMTGDNWSDEEVKFKYFAEEIARLPNQFDLRVQRTSNPNYFRELLDTNLTNPNFEIWTGVTCSEIRKSDSNRISVVLEDIKDQYKRDFDYVIVACGTLQSIRLLLNSKSLHTFDGARNIGQGLMEHFDGMIGKLKVDKISSLNLLNGISKNVSIEKENFQYQVKAGLTFTKEFCEKNSLPTFHIEFTSVGQDYIFSLERFKNGHHYPWAILLNVALLAERGWRKIIKLFIPAKPKPACEFGIWLKCEEMPYKKSKISIEKYGKMPKRTVYKHQISRESSRNLKSIVKLLASELIDSGIGEFIPNHAVKRWFRKIYLRPNWHPMGSLRLGTNPSTSVCDFNLALHSTPRVFLVNPGVFVSGSNCNPVFTTLALAGRCVDFLASAANKET